MQVDRLEVIVEAEAKKASGELDKLIGKLGQVSAAMSGVKGFNMTGSGIKATANSLSGYTKATASAMSGSRSLMSQISRLAFTFYSLKKIIGGVGSAIEKSMDYTETINLFQTTYKKIGMETAQDLGMEWGSETADAYAKGFIKAAEGFNDVLTESLGLDPNIMKQYQAIFAQMTNSMGLMAQSSMNIADSFTMLGNDIASLWNIDTADAMKKLQSGLAGQIRPLRSLGIDISQTSLEMTALKYGIEDTIIDMSQAAKVQLRWLSIMDQTEVAFGDMAKTIDSPKNQLRILSQQWSNLSRSIGNVFLPVISKILPYINAVVIALRNMIDTMATAMGYELPDYSNSNIYTDVTGEIEGMEEAAGDATAANDKLKQSILGFDELNILSKNRSSGSGKTDTTGSGYGVLDDAINAKTASYMAKFNEELEKMSNKSKDMADNIKAFFDKIAEKSEPTVTSLKNLWDNGLSKVAGFVAQGAIDFYDKFLVPVGTWILGEGIPDLVDAINDDLEDVDWDTLNKAVERFWKAISPFAKNVGQGIIDFFKGMSEIGKNMLNTVIPGALDSVSGFVEDVDPETAKGIGSGIAAIATAIAAIKIETVILDNLSTLSTSLKNLPANTKAAITLTVTLAVIGWSIDKLVDYMNKTPEEKKQFWENAWSGDYKMNIVGDLNFPSRNDIVKSWNDFFKY